MIKGDEIHTQCPGVVFVLFACLFVCLSIFTRVSHTHAREHARTRRSASEDASSLGPSGTNYSRTIIMDAMISHYYTRVFYKTDL